MDSLKGLDHAWAPAPIMLGMFSSETYGVRAMSAQYYIFGYTAQHHYAMSK